MSFQPKSVLNQLRREFEAEGKVLDGELFALLETFILRNNPASLKESQEQVRQLLEYIESNKDANLKMDRK